MTASPIPIELVVDRSGRSPRIRARPRPEPGGPPPRWWEDPEAGARMLPPVSDDTVVDAVLMARAVVNLDEQRWKLSVQLSDRVQRVGELEAQVKGLLTELAGRDRGIAAVRALHREAARSVLLCAEPCACSDSEPTGACAACGEPVPCSTIRALECGR